MNAHSWITIPVLMLLSCAPAGHAVHASSREPVARLRDELEGYEFVGSVDERPPQFDPDAVLPRIHRWLSKGTGLIETSIGGTRTLLLGKIPPEVLQELESSLYPDSTPVPLMILRSSFWTRAAKLQGEGLQIGFKPYVTRTADAGLYISEPETVLFDTFAEYGTLTHELEHAFQRSRELQLPTPPPASRLLSPECLERFGRFLGEVDATRKELPEWVGVFSTFDYKPARYQDLTSGEGLDIHSFHDSLLMANLNYPSWAAHWVSTSDCPQPIRDAAIRISIQSQEFMQKAHASTVRLAELRTRYGWSRIHANTVCQNAASASDRKLCEEEQEFLRSIDRLAIEAVKRIDQTLREGFEDRTRFVKEILNGLPAKLKPALCGTVGTFPILGDCL